MNPEKDQALIKTYDDVIQIGFFERHMDDLNLIFAEDFMYYGTGLDEKGLTREQFRELIIRMREQGSDYHTKINITPVHHTFLNNECSAIFVDEIQMEIKYQESQFEINVRHTLLFDKRAGNWVAVHLHASVAYDFQPEGNAWPIEEMKKKNLELEALVKQRTSELNQSLQDLKSAQDQLIHSEKMASLGELTSGIAHEIKNPLNFINNFSDVNSELIQELKEAFGKSDQKTVKEILELMSINLEKVKSHGSRADSILKSMELHSPVKTGVREQVNLNKLIESDTWLAYYSKFSDKESNLVNIIFNLDEGIPLVTINQHDISRSIINLVTNAIDAVVEKNEQNTKNYSPQLIISTFNTPDEIRISVCDNGTGVKDNICNKIFEPFYTTKPTGKGIGLGLSLAYDTITKIYNGTLILNKKKHSNNSSATEFIISLPKSNLMLV